MDILTSSSYISQLVTHTRHKCSRLKALGYLPGCNSVLPLGLPNMTFFTQNITISISFVLVFLSG